MTTQANKLPRPFVLRRLHSLMGLWLCFYLCEHLLVNSQAAWFLQDDGYGFIKSVNFIHSLPYLKAVELILLGLPFLIHAVWGIEYLRTSKLNAFKTSGKTPALAQYKSNRAYSWQRITSWILLIGVIAHVIQMRFVDYPKTVYVGDEKHYIVKVKADPALSSVVTKLDGKFYSDEPIPTLKVKSGQEVVITKNAGSAFFLIVRDTMKDRFMVILYSIFVVAAVYHAFNGLWTWMITWGITLTKLSQMRMKAFTNILMSVVMFLGLIAIWGTYWTYLFER